VTTKADATVTYRAKSLFVSKTFLFNAAAFLVAALSLTEVVDIIPQGLMKYAMALVAVINVGLRLYSVRPVAMIAPNDTKPVAVEKL
jgi:hypothetical protein